MVRGRRVVVTGLGMVSPVGNTVADTWDSILRGRSGVATIDTFDVSAFSSQISAGVKGFDPEPHLSSKEARKLDTFIQYGVVAGMQAVEDAGLDITEENAPRIGSAIGSGIGGIGQIESNAEVIRTSGPRRISPFFVPGSIINMMGGHLSVKYGFRGPNLALVTACTTGTHNIGISARLIASGEVDAMLAGGAEMATTPVGLGGFAAARALSSRNDEPERASRPWDRDRDGFVLGDGAGVVVLEEYEFAKARGANIYAELAGFGMSSDAYHMTLPPDDGSGAQLSMRNTIEDAAVNPDQIQYINAHGTSTPAGDKAESAAVRAVLGDVADRVAVSSTKSMIGHLLGAAGALEAIFTVLSIRDQVAPPTINLDNPDEGTVLNHVPHTAQEMKIDCALSNSFGFGGTNGSLLFKKI